MDNNKVRADFNGLFGKILCLSHEDFCLSKDGTKVNLTKGMTITAFDEDTDENGNPDDLVANGVVDLSPDWLKCNESKWILRIDEKGVYHESDVQNL